MYYITFYNERKSNIVHLYRTFSKNSFDFYHNSQGVNITQSDKLVILKKCIVYTQLLIPTRQKCFLFESLVC